MVGLHQKLYMGNVIMITEHYYLKIIVIIIECA